MASKPFNWDISPETGWDKGKWEFGTVAPGHLQLYYQDKPVTSLVVNNNSSGALILKNTGAQSISSLRVDMDGLPSHIDPTTTLDGGEELEIQWDTTSASIKTYTIRITGNGADNSPLTFSFEVNSKPEMVWRWEDGTPLPPVLELQAWFTGDVKLVNVGARELTQFRGYVTGGVGGYFSGSAVDGTKIKLSPNESASLSYIIPADPIFGSFKVVAEGTDATYGKITSTLDFTIKKPGDLEVFSSVFEDDQRILRIDVNPGDTGLLKLKNVGETELKGLNYQLPEQFKFTYQSGGTLEPGDSLNMGYVASDNAQPGTYYLEVYAYERGKILSFPMGVMRPVPPPPPPDPVRKGHFQWSDNNDKFINALDIYPGTTRIRLWNTGQGEISDINVRIPTAQIKWFSVEYREKLGQGDSLGVTITANGVPPELFGTFVITCDGTNADNNNQRLTLTLKKEPPQLVWNDALDKPVEGTRTLYRPVSAAFKLHNNTGQDATGITIEYKVPSPTGLNWDGAPDKILKKDASFNLLCVFDDSQPLGLYHITAKFNNHAYPLTLNLESGAQLVFMKEGDVITGLHLDVGDNGEIYVKNIGKSTASLFEIITDPAINDAFSWEWTTGSLQAGEQVKATYSVPETQAAGKYPISLLANYKIILVLWVYIQHPTPPTPVTRGRFEWDQAGVKITELSLNPMDSGKISLLNKGNADITNVAITLPPNYFRRLDQKTKLVPMDQTQILYAISNNRHPGKFKMTATGDNADPIELPVVINMVSDLNWTLPDGTSIRGLQIIQRGTKGEFWLNNDGSSKVTNCLGTINSDLFSGDFLVAKEIPAKGHLVLSYDLAPNVPSGDYKAQFSCTGGSGVLKSELLIRVVGTGTIHLVDDSGQPVKSLDLFPSNTGHFNVKNTGYSDITKIAMTDPTGYFTANIPDTLKPGQIGVVSYTIPDKPTGGNYMVEFHGTDARDAAYLPVRIHGPKPPPPPSPGGKNDILRYAYSSDGYNLYDNNTYKNMTGDPGAQGRQYGNRPGLSDSKLNNKALRQVTAMAAGIGYYMHYGTGKDVNDALSPQNIATLMRDSGYNAGIKYLYTDTTLTPEMNGWQIIPMISGLKILLPARAPAGTLYDIWPNTKGDVFTLVPYRDDGGTSEYIFTVNGPEPAWSASQHVRIRNVSFAPWWIEGAGAQGSHVLHGNLPNLWWHISPTGLINMGGITPPIQQWPSFGLSTDVTYKAAYPVRLTSQLISATFGVSEPQPVNVMVGTQDASLNLISLPILVDYQLASQLGGTQVYWHAVGL